MPDSRIYDIADNILTQASARLAMIGVDVPTRQYVHAGQVAIDIEGENCAEELVVTWVNSIQGTPQAQFTDPIAEGAPMAAIYQVWLTRCVPTFNGQNMPSVSDLNDAGRLVMEDAMSLMTALTEAEGDGELVPDGCSLTNMGPVAPYGPSGGAGGSIVQLTVNLV